MASSGEHFREHLSFVKGHVFCLDPFNKDCTETNVVERDLRNCETC